MKRLALIFVTGILFLNATAEAGTRIAMTCETSTGNAYFAVAATQVSGGEETFSLQVREWNASAGSFRRDSIALVFEIAANGVLAYRAVQNRFGVESVEVDTDLAEGKIFGAQGAIAACAAVPLEGDDSYE